MISVEKTSSFLPIFIPFTSFYYFIAFPRPSLSTMLNTSSKSAVRQEKEIKDVATVLFSSVLWVCKIN